MLQLVWSPTARDRDLAYQESTVRKYALEACPARVHVTNNAKREGPKNTRTKKQLPQTANTEPPFGT